MARRWHSAPGSQYVLLLLRLLPGLLTFSHTPRRYLFNLVSTDMYKRAASTFAANAPVLAKLELVAAEWDTKRGALTLPRFIDKLKKEDKDTRRRKSSGSREKKKPKPTPREQINPALLPPCQPPAAAAAAAAAAAVSSASASTSSASASSSSASSAAAAAAAAASSASASAAGQLLALVRATSSVPIEERAL